MKPDLAIVIPYYNIKYFEETIKSVHRQTNKNFSLYIGNDASPDDPLLILNKYFSAEQYDYFNFKENIGGQNLVLQWERVLNHISEPWFQILGDDDVISENFVEEFYANLHVASKNKANIFKYSQCWINESGLIQKKFTKFDPVANVYDLWLLKADEKTRSSLSEHIFRTQVYRKYKFRQYPLAWPSDDMLLLEVGEFGKLIFIDSAKVFVRFSGDSISSKTDNKDLKNLAMWLYYQDVIFKYWKKIPNSDFLFVSLRFTYFAKHANKSFKLKELSSLFLKKRLFRDCFKFFYFSLKN